MIFRFLLIIFALFALPASSAGAARAMHTAALQAVEKDDARAEGLAGAYLAGRMAAELKDLDSSAEFLRKALSYDPKNTELMVRTFIVLIASGHIQEGSELAAKILRLESKDRLALLVTGVEALHNQRFKAVSEILSVDGKAPVSDITSGLLAAWALYGSGQGKKALASLDKLKGPDWYPIFRDYHAGLIAEQLGDKQEAGNRLASTYHVSSAKGETAPIWIAEAYARHLAHEGKKDEALDIVRTFLKRVPENPFMQKLQEDIEAGRAIAPGLLNATQGGSEVLFGLGSALARDGGSELAAIYLQLALYLDSENALGLISLADLYDQLKQPEKVIETLQRVPEISPLKRAAEIQLALTLVELEKTDEALKHLNALLAKKPDDLETLVKRGNVLRSKKRFGEALADYERAISLVPQPPERQYWMLYFFRGIAYERTKQWDKAEADLKKALELQPDQPVVLNYLGYSWIDRDINLEEGMKMLKRAVEQNPNDGYIIDSVGWAYYRMGQYDEAVSWLERAIDKKPGDPTINDHLGDAYWKTGRKLEAYFQWHHAKDAKPEPEDLARIEAKLKDGLIHENTSAPPAAAEVQMPGQNENKENLNKKPNGG